jgi:hypothetical protein
VTYTPGPWNADKPGGLWDGWTVRPGPGEYTLASVHWQPDEDGCAQYDAAANARLIAAAPEMLDALKFWLGAVQNSLALRLALTGLPENAGPALVEMLDQAIAKAEPEEGDK